MAKYQAKQLVSGTVKITAFQELQPPASQQDASHVDVLAFPAGLRWDGLSVEQVGLAIALAAAINPGKVPLRDSERRALAARQVGGGWATMAGQAFVGCCWRVTVAQLQEVGLPPGMLCSVAVGWLSEGLAACLRQASGQAGLCLHCCPPLPPLPFLPCRPRSMTSHC